MLILLWCEEGARVAPLPTCSSAHLLQRPPLCVSLEDVDTSLCSRSCTLYSSVVATTKMLARTVWPRPHICAMILPWELGCLETFTLPYLTLGCVFSFFFLARTGTNTAKNKTLATLNEGLSRYKPGACTSLSICSIKSRSATVRSTLCLASAYSRSSCVVPATARIWGGMGRYGELRRPCHGEEGGAAAD